MPFAASSWVSKRPSVLMPVKGHNSRFSERPRRSSRRIEKRQLISQPCGFGRLWLLDLNKELEAENAGGMPNAIVFTAPGISAPLLLGYPPGNSQMSAGEFPRIGTLRRHLVASDATKHQLYRAVIAN